ncbi:hypothetical protein H0H93_002933 [Arthromyces matolae]|nr:hypothetical protein H0H93_002933 [Arthromyces matolae]
MADPLSPALIAIILDYIVPPSLLAPLPAHLISPALAQRHHFLAISTDDPAQYLSWPSDLHSHPQQTPVDLLECLSQSIHPAAYSVCYTSDSESSFAHVYIPTQKPPGLRLVFQWASSNGWKFHNLTLMPFPPNSHENVRDVLEKNPPQSNDDHDSYWDAYGRGDDDEDDTPELTNPEQDSEQTTEDAYWAQYSTIHGSADSTRPTPPSTTRKLENERVIADYPHPRTLSPYNPLEPPSPARLASLLADISQCPSSPAFQLDEDADSGFESASGTSQPFVAISPPSILLSTEPLNVSTPEVDVTSEALKLTIRGVYSLWRAGLSSVSDSDHERFLDIARQALAE